VIRIANETPARLNPMDPDVSDLIINAVTRCLNSHLAH